MCIKGNKYKSITQIAPRAQVISSLLIINVYMPGRLQGDSAAAASSSSSSSAGFC